MNILEAIAKQEGFDVPGSRAQRNHNPGNIVYGTFATHHGATGEDRDGIHPGEPGFAVFPDDMIGFRALASLLAAPRYNKLTIREAIYIYAPPEDNDTAAYIRNICEMTGLRPTDPISKGISVT